MAKAKNSEKAVKPNIFMRLGLFINRLSTNSARS